MRASWYATWICRRAVANEVGTFRQTGEGLLLKRMPSFRARNSTLRNVACWERSITTSVPAKAIFQAAIPLASPVRGDCCMIEPSAQRQLRAAGAALAVALLSGCVIGNGRICGPQTPMIYCDKAAYERLANPPSLMESWQHPSNTPEARQLDWVSCGGTEKGSYAVVPGTTGAETAARSGAKFDQIQRCMMGRQYQYTGTCQGEIPSRFPACQRAEGAVPQR